MRSTARLTDQVLALRARVMLVKLADLAPEEFANLDAMFKTTSSR
jgi:hypothetical protein